MSLALNSMSQITCLLDEFSLSPALGCQRTERNAASTKLKLEAQPGIEPGYEMVPHLCVAIPPPGRMESVTRTLANARIKSRDG
jgi:hypothetical protein